MTIRRLTSMVLVALGVVFVVRSIHAAGWQQTVQIPKSQQTVQIPNPGSPQIMGSGRPRQVMRGLLGRHHVKRCGDREVGRYCRLPAPATNFPS